MNQVIKINLTSIDSYRRGLKQGYHVKTSLLMNLRGVATHWRTTRGF